MNASFQHKNIYKCLAHAIAFLLPLLITTTSFSQSADAVDAYFNRRMAQDHIPGAAIAVIKNGKVIKEVYYGYANLEDSTPVTAQSVFMIASMSKQFTCAAILLLQEDGKLSIDDKVSKYLDSLPATWQNFTIKQMMNHTTGLRDDWEEDNGYFLENYTDGKMFAAQTKVPLSFAPGENFKYGSGTFDLGLIIKKITGNTYAEFLEQRIFKPLGMTSSSVYDEHKVVPHRAAGYMWDDSLSKMERGYDISAAAMARGDVGVITSIPDMVKWEAAMHDNRLLNEESRRQMFATTTLNDGTPVGYGFGWCIELYSGNRAIEHEGSFRTGFHSHIFMLPDIGESVIFFSNRYLDPISIDSILPLLDTVNIKRVESRHSEKDPDVARTKSLNQFMQNFLDTSKTNEASFRKIFGPAFFVAPVNLDGLRKRLAGFTGLTYLDEKNLSANPLTIYNDAISKIIYYRAESKRPKYLAFNYNKAGKLVCVTSEF